ncbi:MULTISPECIES: helix-turn-helix transcriptional regulator [unclassified Bradyrhizobium]|uniref:helix-turn-helix transcriptional regulator n=1 Tax=unclassified Bradyrhizobium TaxID=2631580 RepID=UPI001BA58D45|nr:MULTISPECIES: helix-turn-helix transcriptional regulator [unclassified Bradyrhizobium]
MDMMTDVVDPAAERTMQFANDVLEASGAAFYRVNHDMSLGNFLLRGVPMDFHRQYVERMNRFDPLHVRNMQATRRGVARLTDEIATVHTPDVETYRSFSSHFGIGDMIEFFFRQESRIVAGMSVMWRDGMAIPDSAMTMAAKMHEYMEFTLLRESTMETIDRKITRYGLTAREREVIDLLCCGRTNREISACLTISLATVKTHLLHIFEKLGVENRSAVVALMSRFH